MELSFRWISVEKEFPEDVPSRIIKGDILHPEKSVKVLVYTNKGTIVNNKRIKTIVGQKDWVWFMDIEGEEITHWCRYLSPVREQVL